MPDSSMLHVLARGQDARWIRPSAYTPSRSPELNAASHEIDEMTRVWNSDAPREIDYRRLLSLLVFLDEQLFSEYLPAVGPAHPEYLERLVGWLLQFDPTDRRMAFRLAGEISFYGSMDFAAMWQAVYRTRICRWLVGILEQPLTLDLEPVVKEAMATTWICPVSDSMNIAGFFHVNNIVGDSIRPDWRSLSRLSSADRIAEYMFSRRPRALERIVLLEDFVGSGTQIEPVLELALEVSESFHVLVCPLLCCEGGAELGRDYQQRSGGRLQFEPLSVLGQGMTLHAGASPAQELLFDQVASLARRLHTAVVQGDVDGRFTPGPLGFNDVASLVVMYTNSPNNTPPILNYYSPQSEWKSPFPRSAREV